MEKYMELIVEFCVKTLPQVALAVVVIMVGLWIIKKLMSAIKVALEKSGFSKEIGEFLCSLAAIALKVMLFFTVAGIVGIDTAAFIAVLAATGFAVGLALQGSLGNFAAGIIILVFKPYKIGDWVEIKDKFGKVEEIQIFNTLVQTPGQKVLIIPNGEVINGVVTNYSMKGFIRMELSVTMPYAESFPKVREILLKEVGKIDKVMKDPIPEIGIESFDSHNIILSIRPYVLPDDYWEVHFAVYEAIKKAFHDNSIAVAYSEGVEMGTIGD